MGGVLIGFAIIAFVIFVGWLLARCNIVDQDGRLVLNRTAFFAASPALLFTVLARADVHVIFSMPLLVALLSYLVIVAGYVLLARTFFTKDVARLAIGANTAAYSNVNNIGLPVAIYVIGDAQYVAPMVMLQLLVIAPLLLGLLDVVTSGKASFARIVTQPLRNPMLIASILGAIVAFSGIELPDALMQPFEILGGAAVPLMLVAFGVSLGGDRLLQPGSGRREILLATLMKSLVMPLVAFVFAKLIFRLEPELVYATTVMAALPTAQNMYQYALRYQRAVPIARDVVLLTTACSLPVMLVIAWLLHP